MYDAICVYSVHNLWCHLWEDNHKVSPKQYAHKNYSTTLDHNMKMIMSRCFVWGVLIFYVFHFSSTMVALFLVVGRAIVPGDFEMYVQYIGTWYASR